MTLPSVTRNFGLSKPDFEASPWHDDVNGNMDKLDSIIAASIGISDLRGSWENDTVYALGDRAVDEDNSVWQVLIAHTSPETGTFEQSRAANPLYWSRISSGYIDFKDEWMPATEYNVGDFVRVTSEYIAAMCIADHTSSSNIRLDEVNWIYLYDLKEPVEGTIANATAAVTAAAAAQVAKITWRGPWVTATEYQVHDAVRQGGSAYICLIGHTSGTFSTDLTATKWELLAQKGADGLGAGDMAASTYDPGGIGANVFAMDNMIEGAATKIMTATERTKLAGIEAGAEVNPTNAEIKAAYEANSDTNAFTDADVIKLASVNTAADQTNTTTVGNAIAAATDIAGIVAADRFAVYKAGATSLRTLSWSGLISALQTALASVFAAASHVHAWGQITGKPTSLAGYGITDPVSYNGHTHDDRYYTAGTVNSLLGAKLGVSGDVYGYGQYIFVGVDSFIAIGSVVALAGIGGSWRCAGTVSTFTGSSGGQNIGLFQRVG